MRINKTRFNLTASERVMGRLMRAPDHDSSGDAPAAEGKGAEPPAGDDQTTEEELSTEQQLEQEFIQHDADEDGEDGPDDDDDGEEEDGSPSDDDDDDDESEEEGDAEESEEEGDEGDKPKDEQREANPELVRRAEEAEREAARLRQEATAKGIDLDSSTEAELPEEPNPEDDKYQYGEHDEQYIKDKAKYDARMEILGEQAETRFKVTAANLDAKWAKNLSENQHRFEDFDEVVVKGAKDGKWDAGPVIAVGIKDSDHGVDIAYRLASNPEEAKRISALSPLEQARELGRMEVRIENEKAEEQRKAEQSEKRRESRRVSNAPKPPKRKIRGGGGNRTSTKADTEDFSSFEKMADEKMAKAASAMGR